MYKAILFDLDGTLTESGPGITRCVQYALEKIGHPEEDLEALRCFVGPPLKEMFMEYAGVDEETAETAVVYYRERFEPVGMYENHLYPGVAEMLKTLKNRKYRLAVSSSKPEKYVRKILAQFGIDGYFTEIVGADEEKNRTTKEEVVREALRRLGLSNHPEQAVLVGDKEHDVYGARACGVECVAVLYGYGTREELEKADPLRIVETPEEAAYFFSVTPLRRESDLYQLWRCIYPALIHFGAGVAVELLVLLISWVTGFGVSESTGYEYIIEMTGITGLITIIPCAYLYNKDRKRREYGRMIPVPSGCPLPTASIPLLLLLGAALSFYGNFLLSLISSLIRLDEFAAEMEMMENGKTFVVLILWMGIVAPIAEETVFRWLIYLRLRDRFGVRVSVIISAVFFGIYHGNLVQAVYAGVLGVVIALTLEATGNIWAPVLLHVGANVFSLSLEQINSSLENAGEAAAAAVYLCIMAVLLVFLIAGLIWVRRQGKKRGYRAV